MSDQKTARVGRRLTQHDRPRLWQRIVVERARGEKWRDVAERAELSGRQCRRIYLAHARSAPAMEHGDVVEQIEDAIAGYDADIEELALIAMTSTSDCARATAVRARSNTRSRKLELLSVLGVVDNARIELDVRAVADAIVQAFDEHGVPDPARRAVLAALERRDDERPILPAARDYH